VKHVVVILASLMLFVGCAHTEPWSKESKMFYGTSVAVQMVDYLQTRSTIGDPQFEESNNMVAGQPDEGQLVLYMIQTNVAKFIVANVLPDKYRKAFSSVFIGINASNIWHNHEAGVKIKF